MTGNSRNSDDQIFSEVTLSLPYGESFFTCNTSEHSGTSQYGAIPLSNMVQHASGSDSLSPSILLSDAIRKKWDTFSFTRSLLSFFPIIDRMNGYSLKTDLIADIIAGITTAILQVPQAIAYALLAGVAPAYGLYTSIFPVFIYAFLGSAHHISIGTMAVVDLMLKGMIDKYSGSNDTISVTRHDPKDFMSADEFEEAERVQIMTSICLLTGMCQILFGLLKLGTVSLIFSDQLISGFSCAAAISVIMSQIPPALGIRGIEKSAGPLALVHQAVGIIRNIDSCNTAVLILSAATLAVHVVFRTFLKRKLEKKIHFPIPIDLIIVVATTFASKYLYMNKKYNVAIIGGITSGIPSPIIPVLNMGTLKSGMLLDSAILAVVCFAIAFSLGKIYAKQHDYTIDANQELFALGSANAFASFFSCFPATASLSRTAVMGENAKSHISSLVSCLILILLLLFFAPALSDLPKSVIAVIIIVAQQSLVMQVKDFKSAWDISRWEGMTWMVTFVAVLLLGIDYGLVIGIIFSIFMVVKRNTSFTIRRLGRVGEADVFADVEIHADAHELPGVKILQFSTPLFFLNKERLKEKVMNECLWLQAVSGPSNCNYSSIHTIIIDCSSVSFVDSSAVTALVELSERLEKRGVKLVLTSCNADVLNMLDKMGVPQESPNIVLLSGLCDAIRWILSSVDSINNTD